MHFGIIPQKWLKKDKYLMNILLVAAWMDGWIDERHNRPSQNGKIAAFVKKWSHYVMPLKPDVVFTRYQVYCEEKTTS